MEMEGQWKRLEHHLELQHLIEEEEEDNSRLEVVEEALQAQEM